MNRRKTAPPPGRRLLSIWAFAILSGMAASTAIASGADPLELEQGDRIVVIGNTLAERMQHFPHFETLLQSRFPAKELIFHDLGRSGDELTLRPRSKDYDDHGHTLKDEKPDVLIAAFGFNESFAGPDGLEKFRRDLTRFIDESTTTKYNGEFPPTLVLLSPIAHEDLENPHLPDGSADNANLELYTDAMAEVASEKGVRFVDLFRPSRELYESAAEPLTINGVHLNDLGYEKLAGVLDTALFGPRPDNPKADMDALYAAIREKDKQVWYDVRAVNGYYIYGGRKEPFGVVNFPEEFAKLRAMIEVRERRVWKIARGEAVPDQIDDSMTGELAPIVTNTPEAAAILAPEEALKRFKLPEGYKIELFASEVEFPDLAKPVAMTFDAKGRLWVTTMPTYPMYLPGTPPDDKVLIFEDTDRDGKADKQTIFADGLHLPGGMELGDGGLYLAQQPDLMFLKDEDGDDHADTRKLILHGFDTADSHHAISAFVWGPGGDLYFQEGTFHQTAVETPYGPTREHDAAVFRYEPRTERLTSYVSYPFANPWGHCFDRWGQDFVADASGGANYFAAAFSGQVDYPDKHGSMKQFLKMQWRPTCGCEIVSSRQFPDETQGDYLLNNTIGFQGILRYRVRDDGSGFVGEPVEPLLTSDDPAFRPVDLEFGPDGALYVVDWYNPLIGHMQHNLRDPNRDVSHGRIYRITYEGRDLVEPAQIAGADVPSLLDLLKSYEDRTRDRARRELRSRPESEVIEALGAWVDGLETADPEYWRQMLEALWLRQNLDVPDQELLKTVLNCPEPRARAAAVRVLASWKDQVDEPLERIRERVNDEHPRVRLEAIRALSFFRGSDAKLAQEIALESLLSPQDYYLEYTLNETNKTLDRRIRETGD